MARVAAGGVSSTPITWKTPRKQPIPDLKKLFGWAAGRCAFPDCRKVCLEPGTPIDRSVVTGIRWPILTAIATMGHGPTRYLHWRNGTATGKTGSYCVLSITPSSTLRGTSTPARNSEGGSRTTSSGSKRA